MLPTYLKFLKQMKIKQMKMKQEILDKDKKIISLKKDNHKIIVKISSEFYLSENEIINNFRIRRFFYSFKIFTNLQITQ